MNRILLHLSNTSIKSSLFIHRQLRLIEDKYVQNSVLYFVTRHKTTTVERSEVDKFCVPMKEWWNPKGKFKLLHSLNEVRVPFIKEGFVQTSVAENSEMPLIGMKILDVGCGGGILCEALAQTGASVVGIDASEELIKVAEEHKNISLNMPNNKPTYYCETIEKHIEQYKNYYDGVVASEVIEHVINPELFMKSCIKALKPGGKLFITTPNRTWYSGIYMIFLAENVFKFIPKGTHEFNKFITPDELNILVETYNCKKQRIRGFNYRHLKEQWDFVDSLRLVYAFQAVKLY